MKTILKSATVLSFLLALAGCNSDNKKEKKVEGGSQASGFALKAELCGSFVSIGDFAEKSGGRRQLSLEIAMGICGKMENSDDKKWQALGMTLSSPEVYLHKPGSAFDATEENKAQVYVEDESKVVAVKGSQKILIGTVESVKTAAKVKLADGIAVELAIGNRAYQISDAKSLPDSDKKLFIATEQ